MRASPTPWCWRSPRPARPLPRLPSAAPRGRRDHEVALDFVADLRGAPASDAESALLLQACDACADDPEADVLLSGAG